MKLHAASCSSQVEPEVYDDLHLFNVEVTSSVWTYNPISTMTASLLLLISKRRDQKRLLFRQRLTAEGRQRRDRQVSHIPLQSTSMSVWAVLFWVGLGSGAHHPHWVWIQGVLECARKVTEFVQLNDSVQQRRMHSTEVWDSGGTKDNTVTARLFGPHSNLVQD